MVGVVKKLIVNLWLFGKTPNKLTVIFFFICDNFSSSIININYYKLPTKSFVNNISKYLVVKPYISSEYVEKFVYYKKLNVGRQ